MLSADASAVRARYAADVLVLSVGRLVPYKGYAYLVDAAAFLPEGWKVVIGGDGPLWEELQERIRTKGVEGKVVLAGYLPQEELPAYFTACDAFVLSSVMKTEAFGIVQIEAMSCGTPVVATRIPESGVSWVNEEGVSGLNAEPADARSLADAILGVEEKEKQFSDGAKQRFGKLFSKEIMINKIITTYEDLC